MNYPPKDETVDHNALEVTQQQHSNLEGLAMHLMESVRQADFSNFAPSRDAFGHAGGAGVRGEGFSLPLGIVGDAGFCFAFWATDSDWADHEDSPKGAATRILYALEHGIPANYREQAAGEAPLSYVVPE